MKLQFLPIGAGVSILGIILAPYYSSSTEELLLYELCALWIQYLLLRICAPKILKLMARDSPDKPRLRIYIFLEKTLKMTF